MQTDTAIEQEIQAKGLTAPRVTPADIEANIAGESACASPENFDANIGRKVARANAVQKIWPLMGYALKDRLYQAKQYHCEKGELLGTTFTRGENPAPKDPGILHKALQEAASAATVLQGLRQPDLPPPHQQRVIQEHADLTVKLQALSKFMDGQLFPSLDPKEQSNLHGQRVAMNAYADILAIRIKGFGITA